jgi:hypothetical protein
MVSLPNSGRDRCGRGQVGDGLLPVGEQEVIEELGAQHAYLTAVEYLASQGLLVIFLWPYV